MHSTLWTIPSKVIKKNQDLLPTLVQRYPFGSCLMKLGIFPDASPPPDLLQGAGIITPNIVKGPMLNKDKLQFYFLYLMAIFCVTKFSLWEVNSVLIKYIILAVCSYIERRYCIYP